MILGRTHSGRRFVAWLLPALLTAACGPSIDVREALEITDVTTGWLDAGIQDGKNKLVPTISFRLKNVSASSIRTVHVNGVFKRVQEEDEWGTAFVRVIGSDGVGPGGVTDPIVLRSHLGYTGEQARAEMFEHSQFVDARVLLFVKHGAAQWASLAEYAIERQLLTQ